MNTLTPDRPPVPSMPEVAKEAVQRATDAAKQATQTATDAAKNCCQTVSAKIDDTVVQTKEYLRRNPVGIVIGAVALGVAMGCVFALSRRHQPTLRERFVDDPLQTTRDTLYAALAPVAQRLHDGYDAARDGAGRAFDKMHLGSSPRSWSDQIGRVGSNLKFW